MQYLAIHFSILFQYHLNGKKNMNTHTHIHIWNGVGAGGVKIQENVIFQSL